MRRLTRLSVPLALLALLLVAAPASAASPTASTTAATNVGQTGATLNGTVNPAGQPLNVLTPALSGCYFEYGTTTSYGSTAACSPTPSGTTDTSVSANITGLTAGTTYHFQVVLSTGLPLLGTTTNGGDQTFKTTTTATPIPVVATTAANPVFNNGAVLNGTVNPEGESVTDCHFLYGSSASSLPNSIQCNTPWPSGSTAGAVSAGLTGLAAGTYYYELVATTAAGTGTGSPPQSFTTNSTAGPTATTQAASSVGSSTATLNGTVNLAGQALKGPGCYFEYGTSTSYGSTVACSPTPSGSSATAVSAGLTGLSGAAAYHYRVVLATASATFTGADMTFTLEGPGAGTGVATSVTATSAVLRGTVNPLGQTVYACGFQYGTTTAYGKTVTCTPTPSGASPVPVSAALTGLAPGTTYHYRVVILTSNGYGIGTDVTFTTLSAPTGDTKPATGVGSTQATLHAVVNVHGHSTTKCTFQYSISPFGYGTTTVPYGVTGPCRPTPSGAGDVAVSVTLSGLASRTTYYFRVVVGTDAGALVGSTLSFHTTAGGGRPGVKITKAKIGSGSASFSFKATGVHATKYQCALVTGKGKVHYASCRSPKSYSHLGKGSYTFQVRAGNGAGYGTGRSKKFRL